MAREVEVRDLPTQCKYNLTPANANGSHLHTDSTTADSSIYQSNSTLPLDLTCRCSEDDEKASKTRSASTAQGEIPSFGGGAPFSRGFLGIIGAFRIPGLRI